MYLVLTQVQRVWEDGVSAVRPHGPRHVIGHLKPHPLLSSPPRARVPNAEDTDMDRTPLGRPLLPRPKKPHFP